MRAKPHDTIRLLDEAVALEVRWVCRGHHRQLDRERQALGSRVPCAQAGDR